LKNYDEVFSGTSTMGQWDGFGASLTKDGREGEAGLVGLFRKKQRQKSLPKSLPKMLPTAPE
jgi:hypothetical protein